MTSHSRKAFVAVVAGLALVGACTGRAEAPPPAASGLKPIDQAALQKLVDATVQQLHVPGAVAVLKTPEGAFTVVSGTTEVGTQSRPSGHTHFRIASNTKTMTSAVALQLAQEGRLKLDDAVAKYVPDVPNGDHITIAELLEMRSGLYNYTNDPEVAKTLDTDPAKVWTPREVLDIAFAHPPNRPPGTDYEYSNTNYALLGLVIEKAGGQPLATAMRDRLFAPLVMKDTLLPVSTSNSIPTPFAHGYLYGSSSVAMYGEPEYTAQTSAAVDAGTLRPTDYTAVNHSFAAAAGGVVSTADDLVTWMQALTGGKVLNPEYQRIWEAGIRPEVPDKPQQEYGYGISRMSWGPNVVTYHGGETAGYNSFMGVDTANAMTLVVWTTLPVSLDNKPTANTLAVQILDQIYVQSPLAPGPTAAPSTPCAQPADAPGADADIPVNARCGS